MKYKNAKIHDRDGDLKLRWFVDFQCEHPETGKLERHFCWISSKIKTRGERRKKADELKRSIDSRLAAGWTPYSNEMRGFAKLSDALDQLVEIKKNSHRLRTVYSYRSYVNVFKNWLDHTKKSNVRAEDFNFYMASEFMDYIITKVAKTNRTYNNYLVTFKGFFNTLIEKEIVSINPFKRIKLMIRESSKIVCFTMAETNIVNNRLPEYSQELYVIAMLVYWCFLRPQEIVRLKIENIDIPGRKIIIYSTQSKNHRQETVIMSDPLIAEIEKLKLFNYPSGMYIFSRKFKPGSFQIAPTRIAEAWKKWADQNGISKNIYLLKHTGAGRGVAAGVNVRVMQKQLRHKSLNDTQVYLDKFQNDIEEEFLKKMPGM